MADDQDKSQKTEDPTSKRLEDAHKKGEVPKSQETKHLFMIGGAALFLVALAGPTARDLVSILEPYFSNAHEIPIGSGNFGTVLFGSLSKILTVMALPFLVFVIAAIAGNMVQHKPVFAFEKINPKLEKISVMKGIKRLFSLNTVVEFLKNLAKISIVGGMAIWLVWPEHDRLFDLIGYDLENVVALILSLITRMFLGVVAIMAVIAIADLLYQKFNFQKQQRMSKQEIKDEQKQIEGDPLIKARLRQVRMERARRRMMAAVPEADVVITNPTHFAVALKYDMAIMPAPKVIAKGVDQVAQRIRDVATENDIPLIENPPLARVLFASVELDQEVPPEHYKAVAEVIGYVMRLKPKRRSPPKQHHRASAGG